MNGPAGAAVPSIETRLLRALASWSVVWGVAVALAVWLAVDHEVDELLDDTLQVSSHVLAGLLVHDEVIRQARDGPSASRADELNDRFAWQLVSLDGLVLLRSPQAPAQALFLDPTPGYAWSADWRSYGLELGKGRLLYVMQTRAERWEAVRTLSLSTALAAFAIGLLGFVWLRARLHYELAPLQRLTRRLAGHDPLRAGATLGPAERAELQPMHHAIDDLAQRLARRVTHERAFTAHAAHALRTPLAGIDAQLAVALREAPAALQSRLQRVRDAAARLQRVVAALLALFRSGMELRVQAIDLPVLLARLPADGLQVEVVAGLADPPAGGPGDLQADPDLLTAALLNLLDNAVRHGAHRVEVSLPRPGVIRLADDGPGVAAARLDALQAALDGQTYEGHTGLGLMLADMVARAHGGRLQLLPVARGFAVELQLLREPGRRAAGAEAGPVLPT